jgi:hypothetical protein
VHARSTDQVIYLRRCVFLRTGSDKINQLLAWRQRLGVLIRDRNRDDEVEYNCSAHGPETGICWSKSRPGRDNAANETARFSLHVQYRRSMLFIKKHRTLIKQYTRSFTGGTVVHRDLLL